MDGAIGLGDSSDEISDDDEDDDDEDEEKEDKNGNDEDEDDNDEELEGGEGAVIEVIELDFLFPVIHSLR